MIIEILYPELGTLYGEAGNLIYLKACCPDAKVIETNHKDVPYFVNHDVDFILCSSMLERFQKTAADALKPYKIKLYELIEKGKVMLFTGNASDLLGQYILREDGSKEEMLKLFAYHTEIKKRINSLILADFEDMQIIGYKAQNGQIFDSKDFSFLKVKGGMGNNKEDSNEGIHYHNLFVTYLTGPFLPQNPLFMKYLLRQLNRDDKVAFEEEAMEAYENSLREYTDPAISYDLIWHNA